MKHLSLVTILFFIAQVALAQNNETKDYYDIFSEASVEASLLFRGQEEYKYPYAGAYNGTYFWESPTFRPGTLHYNGKFYRNILLNINAHTETLLVRHVDGVVSIALDSGLVDWFTIDDSKFFNLKKLGYDVNHNFYQVVYQGEATIYKGVWKTEDTRNVSVNKMSQLEGYNSKLTRAFVPYEEFFYCHSDKFLKIKNKKSLLNLYPEKKKELNRFISSHNLNSQKDLGEYCRIILTFIEVNDN